MLRDRCPRVVSQALKWCKAKEAWLDHVYNNSIWIYVSKKERLQATKHVLGIDKKNPYFVFEDTITKEVLSQSEKEYWNRVTKWVSWFQRNYLKIENCYKISKKTGVEVLDIKRGIMLNYLYEMCPTTEDDAETREKKNKYINSLVDFLIDCFEDRIK